MRDPRVDAYIEAAPDFAQPVLQHLRELVHKVYPEVDETMKWSRPTFTARGSIVCGLSAFKGHCAFGFWGSGMTRTLREAGIEGGVAAGSLGQITSLNDLPKDRILLALLKQAFALAGEEGGKLNAPAVKKAAKPPVDTPADLAVKLNESGAAENFAAMAPSCKREYIEWIEGAKRAETREKRIGEAVGWIAEGKRRNWKYENC